ncbi:glycosyltransferase [Patescibacteria group bacterium]
MRVALIHDHLNQLGGGELVLKAFTEIFPDAPIYTLIYDEKATNGIFKKTIVRESFIARLPFARQKFRWYLPFMVSATEGYDLSSYDVVLSDSSGLAKGVITNPRTLHIDYCHTPTRYLWSDHNIVIDRLERIGIIRRLSQGYKSYLRLWDRLATDRVDHFIANSHFVAERIKKYYRRESHVIYPPVDISQYSMTPDHDNYFLIISRLRPYKRVDIAVKAFNKLNLPLKIIGTGEEENELKKMAKSNIEFLGYVDDDTKRRYLMNCKALLHPQEEDFGITPIEAMACGKPVIAYKAGGAIETVLDGETGILFEEQSWEALADVIIRLRDKTFDPQVIRDHAEKFNMKRFKEEINTFVNASWQKFTSKT